MICEHSDQARHLMLIVRELRELKIDPEIVRLDDDGVSQTGLTLTDELSLIALTLDWDAAMAISREPAGGESSAC